MDQWTKGPMDQGTNGPIDQWTNGQETQWTEQKSEKVVRLVAQRHYKSSCRS